MTVNLASIEDQDPGNVRKTYTVADGTQISFGVLLKLTDPGTVALADAGEASLAVVVAGVAAMEKEANDGSTKISVFKKARVRSFASQAIAVGDMVTFMADGHIGTVRGVNGVLLGAASLAVVAGIAEQTKATGEETIFRMDL